jgi:hypothetical protein
MRSLIAIGALLALLSGVVPAHAVHAWFTDEPLCREACAGTDHCCCKKRQAGSDPSQRSDAPAIVETQPEPCCSEECAVPTGLQRLPSSSATFRAELQQPLPGASLQVPTLVLALQRGQITPARPRAPPV